MKRNLLLALFATVALQVWAAPRVCQPEQSADAPQPVVNEVAECQAFITSDTYYNYNTTISSNLYIMGNATLTVYATITMTNAAKIVLSANSKLIVDYGIIDNCILQMDSGSELILKNDGKLVMAAGHSFKAPQGATLKIEKGRIE